MDLNYLKKFVSNYNETRSKTSLKNVRIPHRKFERLVRPCNTKS